MRTRKLSGLTLSTLVMLAVGCDEPNTALDAEAYEVDEAGEADSEDSENPLQEVSPQDLGPMVDAILDDGPSPLPEDDDVASLSGDELQLAVLPNPQASGATTVEGKLFYNDLREVGNFDLRRDKLGAVGTGAGFSLGGENFLAALDVVADFYELDSVVGAGCVSSQLLGSSTVNSLGEYSQTFNFVETCVGEDQTPDIKVTYRLRFCNDIRCFSVEKDNQDLYKLSHPQASQNNPLQATAGIHVLNTANFRTSWGDDYSLAANVFASLAETTRVWHVDGGVPFYKATYGETFTRFPSTTKSIATTTSPSQIHIPMPTNWIKGKGPMHEFGHTIQMRSWSGGTGPCTDYALNGKYDRFDDPSWSAQEREWPTAALSEGWANYVQRMTTDSCDGGFDDNASTLVCNADPAEHPDSSGVPVTYANDGKAYPRNVTRTLCDWSDDGAHNDNDLGLPGPGDHFYATLYSTWYNMRQMFQTAGNTDCLSMCDYSDYYVYNRNSVAAVGATAHANYESAIADLMFNNGMSCSLPTPVGN